MFAGIAAALVIIIARFISLYFPSRVFGMKKQLNVKTLSIMTWGGPRGGISIALALSLPAKRHKDVIMSITSLV